MEQPNASSTNAASMVVPLWINGEEVTGTSTYQVISPSSNDVCWEAASASVEDALRAVTAAQNAFATWSITKPAHRAEILHKAARIMEQNLEDYAGYMATEMGAQVQVAQFFVLPLAIQMLKDIAGRTTALCGTIPVCQQEGQSGMVWKVPYGVILGIVPWNAPYVFGIRSAATAIATGNATVLKASEITPRCYWAIGKALSEAGLPPGVLNIISCPAEHAEKIVNCMIKHPAVKKINFTGSAATGRKVATVCAQNLKPCLMELGGKNSAIVLDDADIKKAVQACIAGSFLNAGQICMGTDRIIVHEAIASQFLTALKDGLENAAKSHGTLMTIVSSASKTRLAYLVENALSEGASVAWGVDESRSLPGTSFVPTILQGVKSSARIWNEETFGPLAVFSTVTTDEEAIGLVNDTEYGLSAAVFTRDLRRGIAMAKKIEAGAVHINSMTIHDEPSLPFGGVKSSGWGRFNAQEGMDEFLVTKCVTWDD